MQALFRLMFSGMQMLNAGFVCGLLMACHIPLSAQVAGKKVFSFLNLPASARMAALGSNFIGTGGEDISLAWNNPAALNKKMHNHAFATYNNYLADIGYGYFAYARHFEKAGSFSLGVMYVDYGEFAGYTPSGLSNGTFTAQDQCFHLSYGKALNQAIRVGASVKYIYSIYESFVSNGLSADLSARYEDTSGGLSVTGFIRNIGFQAIPYTGTERKGLPLEAAITLSKKLEHLPFRYHLIVDNLQQPDMRYAISQTGEKDENGNNRIQEMSLGDNILRHLGLGGELNLSRNFFIRFGYNHNRRREMYQEQKRGVSGFSWGLEMKISKFRLSYGSAAFFPGYNSNQFSLQVNLSDFYSKK